MSKRYFLRVLVALVLCLQTAVLLLAAPASRPASRPATTPSGLPQFGEVGPTTRVSQADRRKLAELMRDSIRLFKANKLDQVETILNQALEIDPENPTNLYNMGCLKALTNRADEAMDFIEKSAEAGFTDFIHLDRDTDLASLRELPRYKALLARKNEIQKRAAERIVEALRSQFGAKYTYEIDEEDKLIFASNVDRRTLDDLKDSLLTQARTQWKTIFSGKPDGYISVILPAPADYRKIVPTPAIGGFYNDDAKILIAGRMGQVLTHEFTHALHAADRDREGQDEHPIWLAEGLATFFETGIFDGETFKVNDSQHLMFLQAASRAGRLIPLDKLIKMKQPEFVSKAALAYGQSGSLLLYLHSKSLLQKFYNTYKAGYDKDSTGQAAIEKVTGKGLAAVEKDWRQWMLKRTPSIAATKAGGAFIGMRFSQATDGLKIDDVVAGQPGDEAGLKVGDVLVGMDSLDVRDQATLLPILRAHNPGDKVKIRVRRGEEYLELALVLGRRGGEEEPANPPPAPRRTPRPRRPAPAP